MSIWDLNALDIVIVMKCACNKLWWPYVFMTRYDMYGLYYNVQPSGEYFHDLLIMLSITVALWHLWRDR